MSPPAWAWLLLVLEVGILDGLLALAGQPTLSQWLWRQHKKHWWSRWALLGVLIVVVIHLTFGWLGGTTPPPAPPDCPDCT